MTPFIYDIIPRSASGNSFIQNYGIYYISDLAGIYGPIQYIKIGPIICSMLDVIQGPLINLRAYNYVTCEIS
jgi:hypothetical protein